MTREELEQQRAKNQAVAHDAYDSALASIRSTAASGETKARQALNVALAESEADFQRGIASLNP